MAYKDRTLEYHKQGYNCAQAVVYTFKDQFDLDEQTLFKLSEAFGFRDGQYGKDLWSINGCFDGDWLLKQHG